MGYRSYQGFRLNSIWVLIIVNLLLFIITTIVREAIYYLGLWPLVFPSQPWTIVTNLFVHANFGHILGNMLTLYFFGTFLYRIIGSRWFLLVYFGGGLLGNALFLLLAPPLSIGVGASGAIFALGGALTLLRPRQKVFIIPIPVPIPLWAAVIGGFLIVSFLPWVAWQAHLGGLVFGLLMGYFFRRRLVRYY
jgi:membrane associated rhomboid family serine protease